MKSAKTKVLDSPAQEILFSLGFNHDPQLIRGIRQLNEIHSGRARIDEVLGALPDAPLPSPRPSGLLPRLPWDTFADQVKLLRQADVHYNFLLNTASKLTPEVVPRLREYLSRLWDVGVTRITVGTPELCQFAREQFPRFHITISITYGVDSSEKLAKAETGSPDATYLQPVTVNRDFALLRTLVASARSECRLYANVSCISGCPVVRQHYELFASQVHEDVARANDLFFAGCSLVKLSNPVEWIQMPWLRPEDIRVYVAEGIQHFKLSDRLASTKALVAIAKSYMRGRSPADLFPLMERDGAKYRLLDDWMPHGRQPLVVKNGRIPGDFIEHFRRGECVSRDPNCAVCARVARDAVSVDQGWAVWELPTMLTRVLPSALRARRDA